LLTPYFINQIKLKTVFVEMNYETIAKDIFGIEGFFSILPGELDLNYKIVAKNSKTYILKISQPNPDFESLNFQNNLMLYLESNTNEFIFPKPIKSNAGHFHFIFKDANGEERVARVLTWIEGKLWSSVNPKTSKLRESLGLCAGRLTQMLQNFKDANSFRVFDWDLAQASWTFSHVSIFESEKGQILSFFQQLFTEIEPIFKALRKSVIHNDANDNNIIVSENYGQTYVSSLIDFGDAVYSQNINDLAVAIAYGVMDTADPLAAAIDILIGYNEAFKLEKNELKCLYTLVGMRLVISVTKSALNLQQEPSNIYLQVSDKQAWELLKKWYNISPKFATYSFYSACHLQTDNFLAFENFSENLLADNFQLFASHPSRKYESIDLGMNSKILGNYHDFKIGTAFEERLVSKYQSNPNTIWVGGYGEVRPIYTTEAYKIPSNEGFEYRTVHLGVDFWTQAETEVLVPLDGEVVICHNNAADKDYGPTLVLKHKIDDENYFYTLYGHLTKDSLEGKYIGQVLKKGEVLCKIGAMNENGNWVPHLHFQVILDLMENTTDFPGVATPSRWWVYKLICPDPNLLLKILELNDKLFYQNEELLIKRKNILGKSLSLQNLQILRGEGTFLFDNFGQKYLDTVNNVAHVGHENHLIVAAGQQQMAVLNTNTRYLHPEIINYAEELLATFPEELCVVHFVNSGSEANELALRMAKTFTKQKDMIALEWGYHGNTQACIDISSYKFNRSGGNGKPDFTELVPLPDAFNGIYKGPNAAKMYQDEVTEAIESVKSKGRNIAGFIAESIVSCGGQVELPEGFLAGAYQEVRKAGGVCIADEVQVGFGRVGEKFWGFELHGVVPDIVTLGKPIGNGHPLGAVVCTREIADAFANGMEFFNTFGGNPVSCAIGRAVLKEIKEANLQENAFRVGNYLTERFKNMQREFPIIADVRGKGLFLGLEFLEENLKYPVEKVRYLVNRLFEKGILMSIDGPNNNVLKIKPPLVFNLENADFLLANFYKVMKEDFMGE
jgi:4-aminobutyrate aminotransferase-like enzyme/Ser/Thr protein kinase RdoA (MazF antagonist)